MNIFNLKFKLAMAALSWGNKVIQGDLFPDLDTILKRYQSLLRMSYPLNYKLFRRRLVSDPESTRSEAGIFALLKMLQFDVSIEENPSTGGPDFKCIKDKTPIIVEVSNISAKSITEHSKIPKQPLPNHVQAFGLITNLLQNKAIKKASQLSSQPYPRVLVLTSEHWGASMLFDTYSAACLLTSEPRIAIPIGIDTGKPSYLQTDLSESVFFRFNKDGKVEVCRNSISAILLINMGNSACSVLGILHPLPAKPLPIYKFPEIPFARLKHWPPVNGILEPEWIIAKPHPKSYKYHPIISNLCSISE